MYGRFYGRYTHTFIIHSFRDTDWRLPWARDRPGDTQCLCPGYHCFRVSLTLWFLRPLTALPTSRDLLGLRCHRKGGPGRGSRCQAAGRVVVACRPGPQHLH